MKEKQLSKDSKKNDSFNEENQASSQQKTLKKKVILIDDPQSKKNDLDFGEDDSNVGEEEYELIKIKKNEKNERFDQSSHSKKENKLQQNLKKNTIPKKKKNEFKHIEVIRKKSERENLPAFQVSIFIFDFLEN